MVKALLRGNSMVTFGTNLEWYVTIFRKHHTATKFFVISAKSNNNDSAAAAERGCFLFLLVLLAMMKQCQQEMHINEFLSKKGPCQNSL